MTATDWITVAIAAVSIAGMVIVYRWNRRPKRKKTWLWPPV
jgi:cbb3-type cytochrome oxidase subunit 3